MFDEKLHDIQCYAWGLRKSAGAQKKKNATKVGAVTEVPILERLNAKLTRSDRRQIG
jgi:hypothetical protein